MSLKADLVLTGGHILTMAEEGPASVEAAAVCGDRILATGSSAELQPLIGRDTRVIDLDGLTAVPGFNESHSHLISAGRIVKGVDLYDARSIRDIRDKVAVAASQAQPGEWIEGVGWFEGLLEEGRFPTRWDLDDVSPDNPVILSRIYMMDVINSRALELTGINRHTPDPIRGKIDRDPSSGEPTGLLREDAKRMVRDIMPPERTADIETLIEAAIPEYLSFGVTSVLDPGVTPDMIRAYQNVYRRGSLHLRVNLMPDFRDQYLALREQRLDHMGISSGFGNQYLSIGAAKLSLDGGLYSKTADLYKPYVDQTDVRTLDRIPLEELEDIIFDLHRRGWCIGVHACGDRAQDLIVDAYAKAFERQPRTDVRHHLIHGYFPTPRAMQLMAKHDIIANAQPAFIYVEGDLCEKYVGESRSLYFTPLRTLRDAGIVVAINSDVPTAPTVDPMLGIYSAVTRKTVGGITLGDEEKVSALEAIEMYTAAGAQVTMEENVKGRLVPGMLADVAVLDRNPLAIDPEELIDVQCLMTVLGGDVVYEA